MVVYHCHVEMLEVGGQKNSRCAPHAPGFTKWALDRKLHTGLARVVQFLKKNQFFEKCQLLKSGRFLIYVHKKLKKVIFKDSE